MACVRTLIADDHELVGLLIDQAPIGVVLLDGELRILQVNPVARPTFAPIQDLVGRDLSELLHELLG
jgi:hypothetical protein